MSNQGKNRKGLKFGILAAIVVLTMVLCMVMAGCNNEQAATGTTSAPAATGGQESEGIDLYWNIDRALYDGKSEAGMSSREPAEDGYFHVRFFKDGEIVELRVADRKTVNALEVQDLMGLEFDKDGIVVGIQAVDDLPIEQIAWQFYVQSAGGNLIKTNSSASMNGMEVLVEINENTGIYDMSGVTGEIGKIDKPMQGDRVLIVGDEDGNILSVFVYERPNYMNSHEGYCKHCEKDVTWLEWNKADIMPTTTGHYQLTADMTGVTQSNMVEDAKICLDLNGKRVDGASGRRIISMHNAGTELAIMDTSEAKNGRIAAHGQGDQGMCVWVRYGVFYLYEGILDGSDASTQKNSPTLNMGSNTYMYMYGGEIIGGKSLPAPNGKGGWQAGIAGTMQINTDAKFVMNDGLIHGGYAVAVVTKYDGSGQPSAYSAGNGGNIIINGGVMEMNGGTVRDGRAGNSGGNIYIQGKGEFIMNAGLISNGQTLGKGRNGGNLFAGGNCPVTMNGGTIRNGKTYNCGGNVYFNHTFKMTDGIITDGKCLKWGTKEVNDASANRNMFGVQGDFYMYGGRVAGGVNMIDSANDKNQTIILVSARAVIFDEDGTGPHLTLSDTSGGTKCIMYVGQMHDEGKIGISKVQAAVFTEPTNKNNTDNFISDIPNADVGWTEDGLVIGKVHCLCSADPETTTHKPGCDKVQYAWAPWTGTSLPTNGNFYLTGNIDKAGGATIPTGANLRLDLNGYTATKVDGYRMWSFRGATGATMTITDTSEAQTGTLKNIATAGTGTVQGGIAWAGGNSTDCTMNIIAGTLDVTDFRMMNCGMAIETGCTKGFELNMYGGTIKGGETVQKDVNGTKTNYHGGSVYVQINTVFNMYGGLITGGRAHAGGGQGGNVVVRGTMNMYGGTIKDGNPGRATSDANIRVFGSSATSQATLNLYGGTVAGGIDTNNYLVQNTIRVAGDVVVDKNLTSSGCEKPTISLRGGCNFGGSFYPVEIGEMKAGASIYVTPVQAAFSTVTDKANAQYFHADAEGASVAWIDDPANFGLTDADKGKLFIGHVHCICGGSIPSGTVLADGTTHICKPVAFAPADSLAHVEANTNIYLTDDVVLTGQIQMRGAHTLNICLCGHTITSAKNIRMFRSIINGVEQPTDASAFNITTCDASYTDGATDKNALKVYGTSENDGGIFLVNKGTVTLYRGTLNAGEYILTGTKDGSKYGGAINLTGSGKFVQYPNTTVIGGRADIVTGKKTGHGGAVAVNGGTYTMLGGTIKDGIGYQWAGNVHVQSGKFNMYDGLITGGKKINADGSLNPNSTLANVSIRAAGTFNMTGGTVDGRFENVHDVCNNINISGSAKITYNGNIKGNTICVNKGVPNIGTLNDDAQIGLMYSGQLGEGKKVANILDLSTFSMDKVAMNVWFSGITADYTYELKLVGNELWAFETTVTP